MHVMLCNENDLVWYGEVAEEQASTRFDECASPQWQRKYVSIGTQCGIESSQYVSSLELKLFQEILNQFSKLTWLAY